MAYQMDLRRLYYLFPALCVSIYCGLGGSEAPRLAVGEMFQGEHQHLPCVTRMKPKHLLDISKLMVYMSLSSPRAP